MARGANVTLQIEADKVPLLPGVMELATGGQFVTGGGARNAAHLGDFVHGVDSVPEALRHAFFDPQTSGGLLIALAPEFANDFVQALTYHDVQGKIIGTVAPGPACIRLI